MATVLSLALVLTLASGAPAKERSRIPVSAARIDMLLADPARNVRAVEPWLATLLERGARGSTTFARLLEAIERSDVIVHVEALVDGPANMGGRLLFAAARYGNRYVRVQIARAGTEAEQVAVLAHELQHAVEVAEAPQVRSEAALITLYKRIGDDGSARDHFDTAAARQVGRMVKNELG